MSFFGLAQKRAATVITTTYSELSWMSYQDFSLVLEGDVDLRRRMCDFANLRKAMYEIDQAELTVSPQRTHNCLFRSDLLTTGSWTHAL